MKKPDRKARLKELMDDSHMVMFFSKDDDLFATTEPGRMAFAIMKRGNAPLLTFPAINIINFLDGEEKPKEFGMNDLKTISVVSDKSDIVKACEEYL